MAMFFDTKWRRGDNRLASFFTAARQLVSEVESYFSSDEDGNLDRLELLEGRLEQACETLYVVIQRSEDSSSQNPNNLEMAQFNADMNGLYRHLNLLRSHLDLIVQTMSSRHCSN